jgi:hypothetical protein
MNNNLETIEKETIPSNLVDNTPNPSRLIEALRHTGYDNMSAVADLIDNSFDAGASNVWLDIIPSHEDFIITIADDGSGMNHQILDQAMRLGSQTERNTGSDLGKFGMGLVTASLSISRRLTVISKHDGDFLTAIQDLDAIRLTNNFSKELRKSTPDEAERFKKLTNNAVSGTLVMLTKCDRIQNTNINQFATKLTKEMGQVYRLFLDSGRSIYIRGTKVVASDPLMLNDSDTRLFSDEEFDIAIGQETEKIRIRVAMLPPMDVQTAKIKEVNIANQGFYLIRNHREIVSGVTLGIFTKHNDYNRVRIEVFFSGDLDDAMGLTFFKKDVKPNQSVLDKIAAVVYPQLQTIRTQIKRSQVTVASKDIDHDKASKIITAKSPLLSKPPIRKEIRISTGDTPGTVKPTGTGVPRTPQRTRTVMSDRANCQFLLRAMGGGNFFDVDQVGKVTMITYNIDHPFYEKFFIANKDNQELTNALDFLVYSLASAKLICSNEDLEVIFENFMSVFSSNLRTLIH